ncbi:hypothetical protein AYL99_07780 [Fonsecaea erecta]|uniref:Zn(2)-C6 fungal-type domain-containing protein n=1 Tax=Fonsecaea erecta TaxID=1367422 RepID=A0A178ZFX8_9EURO|nr:hypothetical protein AYL99_07780 [Fonsecaea erecta]OAP58690.1 hypothetical protein AYL99_07780 [Fonsecaea erecta]
METILEKTKGASSPPKRRSRKSTPKKRARRVKCDEEKPECRRCLHTGRTCEGYLDLGPDPGSRLDSAVRRQQQQHLPLEPASISTYSIPFKVPGSQADRQLLHYFCCQAAWDLSRCADPALWTQLVLQRASQQSVVRNALVALSALHKDYLCGEVVGIDHYHSESMTVTDTPDADDNTPPRVMLSRNHRTVGMITRCHRQLRKYLSRVDASPAVALVCSVIFYAFESLLGESQQAIWHLDQGLHLLERCQRDGSFDPHDPLVPHLTTLLHQLDLQASCFDDRRAPVLHLATDDERTGVVDIVPKTFLDLTHAEAVLAKLQNCTLHHLVDYVHFRGAKMEHLPSQSFVERLVLVAQLHKYEATLRNFSSREDLTISNSSAHTQREDHRQQRTQRIMRLRVNLYMFLYLVKEHIPFPMTTAYEMARQLAAAADSLSGYPRRAFTSGTATPISDAEEDLESALSCITALLSHAAAATTTTEKSPTSTSTSRFSPPPPSTTASSGTQPTGTTYTLSTQLVASVYFLCLKQTDPRTLARGVALFAHPQLRHARDGLWDTRTASFLVENLVKVRQHGTVTEGRSGSDILVHVTSSSSSSSSGYHGRGHDAGVDLAKLQCIFRISARQGLPMMQSKRFTMLLSRRGGDETAPVLASNAHSTSTSTLTRVEEDTAAQQQGKSAAGGFNAAAVHEGRGGYSHFAAPP